METLLKASEADWALAKRRERVLSKLAASKECSRAMIRNACAKLQLSRAMVFRLLARYKEDNRLSALLLHSRGRKRGSGGLREEQEQIITGQIRKFYLTREKRPVAALQREIAADCGRKNFPAPSYGTVLRRLRAYDPHTLVAKREGYQRARERFRPLRTPPTISWPLELVQIDHTLVDIVVVDELARKPIGRPWVTLAIDIATRAVLGFHLSLAAPNSTSVALTLSMSMLPKDEVLSHIGTSLRWPMQGLPQRIHVDNAREFHSKALQRGCEEYGVELNWRPVHRAHFGGHIERLIGTMMGEVHLLPGTTFSSVAERGQYDSSKRALLTLTELEEWLTLQICGIYHRTRHHSTKVTPMAAWEKAIHHRPSLVRGPQNPKQLYIDFLPFKSRKVRREGLRMFNIFYCSDALGTLLRTSSRSMAVHYDPRNLSCVYIKDKQGEYLEIPYRNLSHPAITLEEHVRATRELQKAKHPPEDEEAIFATIESRRQLIERAGAKTRKVRREAQRQAYALQSATKRGSTRLRRSQEPEESNEVLGTVEPYPVEIWYGRRS
jgi:putative transposase